MFGKARYRLTAWYLLIIMMISLIFSAIIYKVLSSEVDRYSTVQMVRIERRLEGTLPLPGSQVRQIQVVDPDLVSETKQRILFMLFYIDCGIVILAGGLSYFLAGKTLQPIKGMVDEQNRFVSDASHELRTPLTALKSSMEVFLRDKKPTLKEAKELIKENVDDVDKLKELSDDLLALATFEQTNKTIFKRTKLAEVAKEAGKKVQALAKAKKIKMSIKTDKSEMLGDKNKLVQLLVIILDNAIKYSEDKSTVELSIKKTDGHAMINITDHGKGISKKDLPHIFDRFYRAEGARSKDGYGLGLSIAKKITDEHKGVIWAKSQTSKGTIFTIKLPLKKFS